MNNIKIIKMTLEEYKKKYKNKNDFLFEVPDLWDFPINELDYLLSLEENNNKTFALITDRLYEIDDETEEKDNFKNFIEEEIYAYLNNIEGEEYISLTEEQCKDIIDNTINEIMLDNEMNTAISDNIKWYVEHYMYRKGIKK